MNSPQAVTLLSATIIGVLVITSILLYYLIVLRKQANTLLLQLRKQEEMHFHTLALQKKMEEEWQH